MTYHEISTLFDYIGRRIADIEFRSTSGHNKAVSVCIGAGLSSGVAEAIAGPYTRFRCGESSHVAIRDALGNLLRLTENAP